MRCLLLCLAATCGCSLITATPRSLPHDERLSHFPTQHLPLDGNVTVHWDVHDIPFIQADTDRDLAFVLGLTHAHLRGGQLQMMRMISQGRLAEMVGPLAIDYDKTLRILQLGKAAPAIIASMPPETRAWAERYLEGLNHYWTHNASSRPLEADALAIPMEPWRLEELVTVWRLAALDLNWMIYFAYLPLLDQAHGPEGWRLLQQVGISSHPSFAALPQQDPLGWAAARQGSNAIVVHKSKSASGTSALLANDPHLGTTIPNFWLLAGYQSPSYHAVGLMIPGLPFMAVGRNPNVAWGGTNMWSVSSHLYALDNNDLTTAQRDTQPIAVRDWFGAEAVTRMTSLGPVITDSPLLKNWHGPALALRWVGHEPSDEITAFLRANQAQSFEAFRNAFATYAVSGQNLLYADKQGNIGHVMAFRQPVRPDPTNHDLVQPRANAWIGFRAPTEQRYAYNPNEGFIASANNRPTLAEPETGWFFQSSDRVERLQHLAASRPRIGVDTLKTWQHDVMSASALALKDFVMERVGAAPAPGHDAAELWDTLRTWNGEYNAQQRGPAAFEILFYHVAREVFVKGYGEDIAAMLMRNSAWKQILLNQLRDLSTETLTACMRRATEASTEFFASVPTWGSMHMMRAAHPLANLPMLGNRYVFADYPVDGGNDTLMKAAHPFKPALGKVFYGANARFIADLSDPDANEGVLFGGQDGWLTSPSTLDQVELWRRGEYVALPLSPALWKKNAAWVSVLRGGPEDS